MSRRLHWLAAVALVGACASESFAAAQVGTTAPLTASITQEQAQELVRATSGGRGTVRSVFAGPDGLNGAIVDLGGGRDVVTWISPHGKAIFVDGPLLGVDGSNLSEAALIAQGVQASPEGALAAAAAPAAKAFVVGTAGPIVTAFFDPNCIYCHHFYEALAPEIAAGNVRVRYVMVGTLKESSIPRAASILAAADPAAALHADEEAFDVTSEEGGYAPMATLDPAAKAAVESNNQLFAKAGARGTPAALVCSKESGKVVLKQGAPRDIKAFIADASGKAHTLCY